MDRPGGTSGVAPHGRGARLPAARRLRAGSGSEQSWDGDGAVVTVALLVGMGLWGHFDHTIRIFPYCGKTAACSAQFFGMFLCIRFPPFVKSSAQCNLRSGHQVSSSDQSLKKHLWLRRGYSFKEINVIRSGADKGVSTYKTYVSKFWLRWPEITSISWPCHYKAMGKCSDDLFSKVRVRTC